MRISQETAFNGLKKQRNPATLEEIATLLKNLSMPPNSSSEDIVSSVALLPSPSNKRQRNDIIENNGSIVAQAVTVADALKPASEFRVYEVNTQILVHECFYNYYYYKYNSKDVQVTPKQAKSKIFAVVAFMVEQLPHLYESKMNSPIVSEVEKAELVLKREQFKEILRIPKPNEGSAAWALWDQTLRLAGKALLAEVLILFKEALPPVRTQINSVGSVYSRLCQYIEIKKGLLTKVPSTNNDTKTSSSSSLFNFFYSNTKEN
jgi:hypothetical protein